MGDRAAEFVAPTDFVTQPDLARIAEMKPQMSLCGLLTRVSDIKYGVHDEYVFMTRAHTRFGFATKKMRENGLTPDEPAFLGLDLGNQQSAFIDGLSDIAVPQPSAIQKAQRSAITD